MHPLIASTATDAFGNLVSVLDLAVQASLLTVAAAAAFYAKKAFETQDVTLSRLIQDKAEAEARRRVSESPFLNLNYEANEECQSVDLGGGIIIPGDQLFSSANRMRFYIVSKDSKDLDQIALYFVLKNLRPQNSIMSMVIRNAEKHPGITSCRVARADKVMHASGQLEGDYWMVLLNARAWLLKEQAARLSFDLAFETIAGHRDTHRYDLDLSSHHWKRVDPSTL